MSEKAIARTSVQGRDEITMMPFTLLYNTISCFNINWKRKGEKSNILPSVLLNFGIIKLRTWQVIDDINEI